MSATTICQGHWDYRTTGWMVPWTATDRRTGQVYETGALTIAGAKAFTAALAPARPAAGGPVRFTIAGGPQRARAGHQRYTTSFTTTHA